MGESNADNIMLANQGEHTSEAGKRCMQELPLSLLKVKAHVDESLEIKELSAMRERASDPPELRSQRVEKV